MGLVSRSLVLGCLIEPIVSQAIICYGIPDFDYQLSKNIHPLIISITWTRLAPRMSVFPSPARCRGIPPDTPHSIIFSLPEWEDNVELVTGNKILINSLETTYPRFVIHMFVKQVRCILYYPFGLYFIFIFYLMSS